MLRIHFLQQWFNLSDPAMEEALYDTPLFRVFAGLDLGEDRLPDESTILRFRHLLEAHDLSIANAGDGQRHAQCQGLAAQARHRGGCHINCGAQLHQEQHGRLKRINQDRLPRSYFKFHS
jgi:IS5 family transposase